MHRRAATVLTTGVVLLTASLAIAQGATPNAPAAGMPPTGAPAGAGTQQQVQQQLAQFTGVVKEYNNQDRVVLMDNGDKFYLRSNQPATGLDELRPGNRVTVTYYVDPGEQNEKFIRAIQPAQEGAPAGR